MSLGFFKTTTSFRGLEVQILERLGGAPVMGRGVLVPAETGFELSQGHPRRSLVARGEAAQRDLGLQEHVARGVAAVEVRECAPEHDLGVADLGAMVGSIVEQLEGAASALLRDLRLSGAKVDL